MNAYTDLYISSIIQFSKTSMYIDTRREGENC